MWCFIFSGALYLVGVAVILVLRPTMMFTPDGNWKEFGIGQREDRYTPFPFWLFCLVWAVVAYVIVLLVAQLLGEREGEGANANANMNAKKGVRNTKVSKNNAAALNYDEVDIENEGAELPKGYYVLNRKATKLSGVPKYIYLGPENPDA